MMEETYYKAVRPDGTSFYDSSFRWIPEKGIKRKILIKHPSILGKPRFIAKEMEQGVEPHEYLSVSTDPKTCYGFMWPCRLLEVVPIPQLPVWAPHPEDLPNKRASMAWKVVREVEPWRVFGPNGEVVANFLDKISSMSPATLQRIVKYSSTHHAPPRIILFPIARLEGIIDDNRRELLKAEYRMVFGTINCFLLGCRSINSDSQAWLFTSRLALVCVSYLLLDQGFNPEKIPYGDVRSFLREVMNYG